jgi:DNA ligase-1
VGRSSTLLKVKSFFDAEALVIEHQAGTGRHQGRLGALLVELPDGVRFSVGTGFSDKEREGPPPAGAIVTFRYQELSDTGVPRFPSYVGIRHDVRWPPDNAVLRRAAASAPTDIVGEKPSGGDNAAPPAAPKAAPAAPKAVPAVAGGAARRFEFSDGTASKFWEIEISGPRHTVRYGRIGADGQSKTKDFADDEAAKRDAAKLIEEKTRKGYVET